MARHRRGQGELDLALVRRHGPVLVSSLVTVLRPGLGGDGLPAEAMATLLRHAGLLAEVAGSVRLDVVDGGLLVCATRLRVAAADARKLAALLVDRGVSRLEITPDLGTEDIEAFAAALRARSLEDGERFGGLSVQLAAVAAAAAIAAAADEDDRGAAPVEVAPAVATAAAAYEQLASVVHDVRVRAGRGEAVPLRLVKRALADAVDALEHDRSQLLALAWIGPVDAPLREPLSVALLAMAMAAQLDMPPRGQSELGLAALLLEQAGVGGRTPDALPALVRGAGVGDATARCLLVARELQREAPAPSLFTGIVATARAFVRRTADGAPSAAEVLHELLETAADADARDLARLLVATLGTFPPGSLVRLSSGELAAVVVAARADPDRPTVRLLTDAKGSRADAVVDLADQQRDTPPRHVAAVLAVAACGLSAAQLCALV